MDDHIMGLVSTTGPARSQARPGEKRVSSSTLHRDTRATLDLLKSAETVAVTHYNEVEGYLVAPDQYANLVERATHDEAREAELPSTLRLLLSALKGGVPIPSESLKGLVPAFNIAEHWREVAEFAATRPVTFNAGEHGEPIARVHLSPGYGYIADSGTDDELNLD